MMIPTFKTSKNKIKCKNKSQVKSLRLCQQALRSRLIKVRILKKTKRVKLRVRILRVVGHLACKIWPLS